MKHIFIINPAAGSRNRTQEYAPMIRHACNTRDLEFEIEISKGPGDCTRIAREAAKSGEEVRLYACGGDGISHFVSLDFIGTSSYEGEDGWCTFSTKIDTSAFDKIAFIVTDLGGEVLIDNVRVFVPEDGSNVSDLPGGGNSDSSTTVPIVRPTTTLPTSATTTTTVTKPVVIPSSSAATSGDGTILPTDVVTDPTAPVPTDPAPSQDDVADPTAPVVDDAPVADADAASDETVNPVVLWVSIGVAALILAAGGVPALLLLKKKQTK